MWTHTRSSRNTSTTQHEHSTTSSAKTSTPHAQPHEFAGSEYLSSNKQTKRSCGVEYLKPPFVLLSEPTRVVALRPFVRLEVLHIPCAIISFLTFFPDFCVRFLPYNHRMKRVPIMVRLGQPTLSGCTQIQDHEALGTRVPHNTNTKTQSPPESRHSA